MNRAHGRTLTDCRWLRFATRLLGGWAAIDRVEARDRSGSRHVGRRWSGRPARGLGVVGVFLIEIGIGIEFEIEIEIGMDLELTDEVVELPVERHGAGLVPLLFEQFEGFVEVAPAGGLVTPEPEHAGIFLDREPARGGILFVGIERVEDLGLEQGQAFDLAAGGFGLLRGRADPSPDLAKLGGAPSRSSARSR